MVCGSLELPIVEIQADWWESRKPLNYSIVIQIESLAFIWLEVIKNELKSNLINC